MKNKIKLMFILCLTLFGFGVLFSNVLPIVEADAATGICDDNVSNVKGMPVSKEIKSESDPYEIDEINVELSEDFLTDLEENFIHGKNLSNWDHKITEIVLIASQDQNKYCVYDGEHWLEKYTEEEGSYQASTWGGDFYSEFVVGSTYKLRTIIYTQKNYYFADEITLKSSNPKLQLACEDGNVYVDYEFGKVPYKMIEETDFKIDSSTEESFVIDGAIAIEQQRAFIYSEKYDDTVLSLWKSSIVTRENGVETTMSGSKYIENQTYFVKTVYHLANDEYLFSEEIDNEYPGYEFVVSEGGEKLTIYYEFTPHSLEIEEFIVKIDIDALTAPIPNAYLYDGNKTLIVANSESNAITHNTDASCIVSGDTALSTWGGVFSTHTGGFRLNEGKYGGYYTEFYTDNYITYKQMYFTEETVVKAVDLNGNPITENFYYEFSIRNNRYPTIHVVYDLGLCEAREGKVEELEIVINDFETISKYSNLFPGDDFDTYGYHDDQSIISASLAVNGGNGESVIAIELKNGTSLSYLGIYYNDNPELSLDQFSGINNSYYGWYNLNSSNTLYDETRYSFIYKLSLNNPYNSIYSFNDDLVINFVDALGNEINLEESGLEYYIMPYYNDKSLKDTFYVVLYLGEASYVKITDLELVYNKTALDSLTLTTGAYAGNPETFPVTVITDHTDLVNVTSEGKWMSYDEENGVVYDVPVYTYPYYNNFRIVGGYQYAFAAEYTAPSGCEFDLDAIEERLADTGFKVDKESTDGKIVIYYLLPVAEYITIDELEFEYFDELEPTIGQLAMGAVVPNYATYDASDNITQGVILVKNQNNNVISGSNWIKILSDEVADQDEFWDANYLYPGATNNYSGYAYLTAYFGPALGCIFDAGITITGVPNGYEYEIIIDQNEPEYSYVIMYKHLGEIEHVETREEITSVDDVSINEYFMTYYQQGRNLRYTPLQVPNSNEYYILGGQVYTKQVNNGTETLEQVTGTIFKRDVQYVGSIILLTGTNANGLNLGNYVFADEISLPTGYTWKEFTMPAGMVDYYGPDATAIEIYYELPKLIYSSLTTIQSINVGMEQWWLNMFNEGNYRDVNNSISILDQNPNYYKSSATLYYVNDKGELVKYDLAANNYNIVSGLDYAVEYIYRAYFGYEFAANVQGPSEFVIRPYDTGEGDSAIQVFYTFGKKLLKEEVKSVNAIINESFLAEYMEGRLDLYNNGYDVEETPYYTWYYNNLYYEDANGQLVYIDVSRIRYFYFEPGVQYHVGVILVTGYDNSRYENYKFANNVSVPSGYYLKELHSKQMQETLDYFGEGVSVIEVAYKLPLLEIKEIEEVDIEMNPEFLANFPNSTEIDEEILYESSLIVTREKPWKYELGFMAIVSKNDEGIVPADLENLVPGVQYYLYVVVGTGKEFNKPLYVFAEDIKNANDDFDLERISQYQVLLSYELPIITAEPKKPSIEFTYDEEYEPTIEELAFGNMVPIFVDYERGKGFIWPAASFEAKLDGGIGIVVHETKTPEDYSEGKMLIPGKTVDSTGYAFAVAVFRPWNGFTFTEDMEIIGLPDGYEYKLEINETNPENSRIVIYKYLGQIKKFIEFTHDAELEPTIEELALGNTVPAYVDYERGKGFILPAANSESKAWGEIGLIVYQTKTIENYQSGQFLAPGSTSQYLGHVFAMGVFGPGYNFTFTEDMEIVGLPEGYEYKLEINETDNRESILLVYKYLGELRLANLNDEEAEITLTNTLVYNGQAQTQQIVVKYDGVTLVEGTDYTVSGNVNTNANTYELTVTGIGSYAGEVEVEYTIAKATYDMSGITFADVTVTYDGAEHKALIAGTLPTGVSVAYENNTGTNAGTYNAVAKFTGDANYNAIPNMNATLTINKATYNMTGITFADVTVIYDGAEHKVVINGTLPTGVTVAYTNNVGTNVGTYNAVAKFTGDANYNAIADMNAVLTIKTGTMSFDTNKDDDKAEDVIVTAPEGIDPNKELYVEMIEMEESDKDFSGYAPKGHRVGIAYDVKLLKDGVSVQPDGTLVIKMLIPEELKGKNFSIMHVHNNGEKVTTLEHEIDGDYVVVETKELSEFVFVYEMGSLLWIAIVLAVIAMLEGGFLVFMMTQKNRLRTKKLAVVYPPFVFGMFVPEWHIVLIIVFAVIVAALAAIDIVYALSFFGLAFKKSPKSEEDDMIVIEDEVEAPQVEEVQPVEENQPEVTPVVETEDNDDEDEDDTMQVWDEETHSFTIIRILKSFTARLIQSKDEVKDYYDIIKNELLSYKKVKSRISFKHEAFKFGKENIARLRFRGKTLCLYLALNPADYENSKYKVEDMSAISNSADVPTMYRITLPRRVDYAKELIYDLMKKLGAEQMDIDFVNYSNNYPYEDNEALLEKGLIKKSVKVIGSGTSTKTIVNPVNIVKKVSATEVNNLITDEQVISLIEQSTRIADKTKKTIINIDTLSQYFNENETVTLEEIKKRIPNVEKKATYYKVLARGVLDKPLTVDADDFSIEAEKMIVVTGGKVLVSKAK